MAFGQAALDGGLAFVEPVHGGMEVVFAGLLELEFLREGGGVPQTGGGEFGGGLQKTLGEHGQDTAAVAGGAAVEQGGDVEFAAGVEDEFDMAVEEGADDGEGLVEADEGLVAEQLAQGFDLGRGPGGEVGEGALADALALAPAFAEEDGRGRVAVRDDVHVHGNIIHHRRFICQMINGIYTQITGALHGNTSAMRDPP